MMRRLRVICGIIGVPFFLSGLLFVIIDIYVTFLGYPKKIFQITNELYRLTTKKQIDPVWLKLWDVILDLFPSWQIGITWIYVLLLSIGSLLLYFAFGPYNHQHSDRQFEEEIRRSARRYQRLR